MMEYILLYAVFTEAVVNLIFNGTVLQPAREFIIRHTPFLLARNEHLLTCKLCTSVWVGLLSSLLMILEKNVIIEAIILGIIMHRCSNYLHAIIAIIYDVRLDMLVKRRKL